MAEIKAELAGLERSLDYLTEGLECDPRPDVDDESQHDSEDCDCCMGRAADTHLSHVREWVEDAEQKDRRRQVLEAENRKEHERLWTEIARLRGEVAEQKKNNAELVEIHNVVAEALYNERTKNEALTATVDGLREAQTCASCRSLICPPMQCGRCIETGRPVEGMPERPATINLQEKVQALTAALEEARGCTKTLRGMLSYIEKHREPSNTPDGAPDGGLLLACEEVFSSPRYQMVKQTDTALSGEGKPSNVNPAGGSPPRPGP